MIPPIIRGLPVVDAKGLPTDIFWNWLNQVTDLQPLTGSGSPEGVVEAMPYRVYLDTSGSPVVVYVKVLSDISGDRTEGWRITN